MRSSVGAIDRTVGYVLGIPIDAVSWEVTMDRVLGWAHGRESRYITICNVHVVVTAAGDGDYRGIIEGSDLATPDGAPVAWMLRRQGFADVRRISGPDLMAKLLVRCAEERVAVYLYGGTQDVLAKLRARIEADHPVLGVAGAESPPFRALSPEEDDAAVARINNSGAGIVFVGLGCPKQEQWMAAHKGRVKAVMIGVGAAFDFHAGTVKRAPRWMQTAGLEWLHRLASEPRRLWRRYLVTNSLFLWGAFMQVTGLGYRH